MSPQSPQKASPSLLHPISPLLRPTSRSTVLNSTTIEVLQADLLSFPADILVTRAQPSLHPGTGLDAAIHAASGPYMLAELRRKFPGGGVVGAAYFTGAYNISHARYVIHAIGPDFRGANTQAERTVKEELVGKVYRRALDLAVELGARSIAFPTIATGVDGFPLEEAAVHAMVAIRQFVEGEGNGELDRISVLLWPVGGDEERPSMRAFEETFLPKSSSSPTRVKIEAKKRKAVHFNDKYDPEMGGLEEGESAMDRFTFGPTSGFAPIKYNRQRMGGLKKGESRRDRFTLGPSSKYPPLEFDSEEEAEKVRHLRNVRRKEKQLARKIARAGLDPPSFKRATGEDFSTRRRKRNGHRAALVTPPRSEPSRTPDGGSGSGSGGREHGESTGRSPGGGSGRSAGGEQGSGRGNEGPGEESASEGDGGEDGEGEDENQRDKGKGGASGAAGDDPGDADSSEPEEESSDDGEDSDSDSGEDDPEEDSLADDPGGNQEEDLHGGLPIEFVGASDDETFEGDHETEDDDDQTVDATASNHSSFSASDLSDDSNSSIHLLRPHTPPPNNDPDVVSDVFGSDHGPDNLGLNPSPSSQPEPPRTNQCRAILAANGTTHLVATRCHNSIWRNSVNRFCYSHRGWDHHPQGAVVSVGAAAAQAVLGPNARRLCRAWLPANRTRPDARRCQRYCTMRSNSIFCTVHRNWGGVMAPPP